LEEPGEIAKRLVRVLGAHETAERNEGISSPLLGAFQQYHLSASIVSGNGGRCAGAAVADDDDIDDHVPIWRHGTSMLRRAIPQIDTGRTGTAYLNLLE
jgi:hypothetical protein